MLYSCVHTEALGVKGLSLTNTIFTDRWIE